MMRRRFISLVLAAALALGLAPAALAAAKPSLGCNIWYSKGEVELYLEDLDGSDIYGVQVEMTLAGEYSDCAFSPDSDTAYAPDCGVDVRRDRTYVTIYLTDREPLNGGEENCWLGVLHVDGIADGALPEKVRIILLDKNLRPMTGSMSGSIPTNISVRKDGDQSGVPNQPAAPVTPSVPMPPDSSLTPQLPGAPLFTDVRARDWFYDAVAYVCEKGMMRGTTDTTFSPNTPMDRAMVVTILYRLEGSPAALPSAFTDVAANAYYAAPVAWASASGIVNGYEDGTFRPNVPITREQLAAILYRYAQSKGLVGSSAPAGSPNQFPDAARISPYAADAISWALGAGLLTGSDGMLLPQGSATRAQAAVILQRFCTGLMGMS